MALDRTGILTDKRIGGEFDLLLLVDSFWFHGHRCRFYPGANQKGGGGGVGSAIGAFARSRIGAGFGLFVSFSAVFAVFLGYGGYRLRVDAYAANERAEKMTALRLVDAFTTDYADILDDLGDRAPALRISSPMPSTA
jgi:hypothetical protein